jgi:hypothetical protein
MPSKKHNESRKFCRILLEHLLSPSACLVRNWQTHLWDQTINSINFFTLMPFLDSHRQSLKATPTLRLAGVRFSEILLISRCARSAWLAVLSGTLFEKFPIIHAENLAELALARRGHSITKRRQDPYRRHRGFFYGRERTAHSVGLLTTTGGEGVGRSSSDAARFQISNEILTLLLFTIPSNYYTVQTEHFSRTNDRSLCNGASKIN